MIYTVTHITYIAHNQLIKYFLLKENLVIIRALNLYRDSRIVIKNKFFNKIINKIILTENEILYCFWYYL